VVVPWAVGFGVVWCGGVPEVVWVRWWSRFGAVEGARPVRGPGSVFFGVGMAGVVVWCPRFAGRRSARLGIARPAGPGFVGAPETAVRAGSV
jgi:hypothetical protein